MGSKRFDQFLNEIVGGMPKLPSSDELNDSGKVSAGDIFASAKNAATSQQGDAKPAPSSAPTAAPKIEPPQRTVPDLTNAFKEFQQKRADLAAQREAEQKKKDVSETQKAALNASDNPVQQNATLKPSANPIKPVSHSGGGAVGSSEDTAKPAEPTLQKPTPAAPIAEKPAEKTGGTKKKKTAKKQQSEKKTPVQKAIEEAVGEKSGLKQDKSMAKKMQDFYNKHIARTQDAAYEAMQNDAAAKPHEPSYDEVMQNNNEVAEPREPSYDEVMSAGSPNSMLNISWDEFEKLMNREYGEDRPNRMIDFKKMTTLSPTYDSMFEGDSEQSPTYDSMFESGSEQSPTYESIFDKGSEQSPTFDSLMQSPGSSLHIGPTVSEPKNDTLEDILSVPAFNDFYQSLVEDSAAKPTEETKEENETKEGTTEDKEEERTDNIAKKLKTPNEVMDERIGLLKENAKNTAPAPLIHERKDDTVRRSKEILSFLRKGVKISGDEKVKVNTDDAKEYFDNRAEEEVDEEFDEENESEDNGGNEAVKTTRVPSRMTRQTFEEIEERSKEAGAKHKQKELKTKRAALKRDLADVNKIIKELEEKDKESLSNTERELNTAKLFGQRKKAKALNDEIKKVGEQLGLKENKVTFGSKGKINFNRFSNQKFTNYKSYNDSKKKKGKKGKKNKKGFYSSKNKKYAGKQTRSSYAWRKQNATEKAKKLKMKEVTLHSKDLDEAVTHFCTFLKLNPASLSDRATVMEMALWYSGICPDRDNKLFDKPLDKAEIKDHVYMDAFQQMERNYREDGFLFSYRDFNYKIAGNYRFVVPIMPPKIAKTLTRDGALLENWSIEELARAGYNEWLNKVVPSASVNAKKNQRLVLNDMMKAVAWSYGDSSLKTGLLDDDAFTINEAFDTMNDYASLFPNHKDLVETNNKCRQRVLRAKNRIERRHTKTVKGQDGTYKTLIDIAKNSPDVFASIVKLQRAQSLMLDVTLGASSALEHMKGNFSNSMAAKILLTSIKASGPTAATYEMAKTKEVQQTIMDAVQLLQIGGPDALVYALDSGYVLGQGDARDFAQQFLLKRGLTSQEAQNYMNMSPNERVNWIRQNKNKAIDLLDKYANLASNFATGEWVCQGGDAKRFFEFMLYNGQKDRNKGGMNLDPVTLERMLLADPQGTITGLVARPEGINSLVTMMDCTLGGMNPLTSFYDDMMGRLGICDLAFANFVTLFPKYGFMAMGKVLPMSHSGMYLASLGYYLTKSVVMQFSGKGRVGDISAADTKDRLDTLIGGQSMKSGSEEFMNGSKWEGFKEIMAGLGQNIIMDFAQFSTNAMFLLVQLGVLMLCGFKEPPDPKKKFVYSEWRLFTNLTPDGEGVQIKTNWFLNEIYGMVGGPAVLAAAIGLRDGDWATAHHVYRSGGWDIMMNTGFSQLAKLSGFITDFDKQMIEAQTGEQVEGGDPLWNKVLLTAVSGAVSCIEPRFIKTLYSTHDYTSEGNLAHSTTQIYDQSSDDKKRTTKTTAEDSARRRLSYNDPAMAAIFDFVHFIGGEKNATGYFRNEMPLVTEVEPTSMVWKKYFGEVDGRELTWDSSDEDKQVIVNRVLDAYDRYGGIDGMIDNGIVIPYVSRYYVTSYLYACQNANWNGFYERQYSKGGFSSQDERQEASDEVQQKNAALNEQIKAIQDSRLPYSPYTLNRYETDYWKYYYAEDENGERTPTDPLAYWWHHDILHDPSYHEEYYASGDHKSSLNPFLMVDTDNTGTYDRQKKTPWYNEDGKLDKEQLLADIGDEVIESGQFKGQKLADVIGGQLADQDDWVPTTGSRASVYVNNPWETDHEWPGKKDSNLFTGNLGENGKNKTSEEWKESNKSATNPSSAGWGYTSSRRYSGSGRAASIYSRPASSLNADRAATMYSKNRNYTRYDYLRPDFETKGSRDAYKRSDI